MRVLLDSHTLIWAADDPAKLSATALALIRDAANDRLLSAATIWEIAIKHALGKDMPISAGDAINYFRAAGYEELPVTPRHAAYVENLPPLHADPFDRILVAQALTVPLRLVTHDKKVAAYGGVVLAV